MKFATGSLCLSDIPKELIKRVMCQDGVERAYLNISIGELKEPQKDDGGKIRTTHFVSCQPPQEQRVEGKNYFIGNLKEWQPQQDTPSPQAIDEAPSYGEGKQSGLPF